MAQTQFLAWPVSLESEAQAYVTAANDYSQSHFGEQFAASWYPREDVHGCWISPYFGPPAVSPEGEIEEPEAFVALREGAEFVAAATIEWPEEEE